MGESSNRKRAIHKDMKINRHGVKDAKNPARGVERHDAARANQVPGDAVFTARLFVSIRICRTTKFVVGLQLRDRFLALGYNSALFKSMTLLRFLSARCR